MDLCITQARYTQLHRHINYKTRIMTYSLSKNRNQLRCSLTSAHTPWPVDEELLNARCNMEQSMKTVTNVTGLKCYRCARLQTPPPSPPVQVAAVPMKTGPVCVYNGQPFSIGSVNNGRMYAYPDSTKVYFDNEDRPPPTWQEFRCGL